MPIALFIIALLLAPVAHAQVAPFFSPLEIRITPDFPEPDSGVSARVTSPTLDLSDAQIAWRLNDGEPVAGGRDFAFRLGPAGATTEVSVSVAVDGVLYEASQRLLPASVDLVWSASTYAPPLYPGKSIASPGSRVRIEALPSFIVDDASVQADELIFTWYRNNALLEGASGRGRDVLEIAAPILFATDIVRVEVTTLDRRVAAEGRAAIRTDDPLILLYENHPIFGMRLNRALKDSAIAELEATVTAVPLNAAYPPRDRALIYEWFVNGRPLDADASYPNSLTLNAEDSSGIADIRLALAHVSNIFFSARGQWDLTLRSGADIRDPFFAPRN